MELADGDVAKAVVRPVAGPRGLVRAHANAPVHARQETTISIRSMMLKPPGGAQGRGNYKTAEISKKYVDGAAHCDDEASPEDAGAAVQN